ncbi:MAG: hypothetical protein DCF15_05810 [Phormidesmis priestleyi]|uniref:Probable membrane transporter protein n=1 Tax=Phormidesmis priestleyi TaxID=268141 RepID=A0A2W4XMY5_9CYAN|nr:MAG: hypothetical protein DCF15_05810 [Phormidesmis priestleyi]
MAILLLIFVVGLAAGFVDAIAGGGGLVMLPALIFSGLPVSSAIATNKLCGTFGALASSLKFAQSKQIDWWACVAMGIPAVIGAYAGSRSIGLLPAAWAEPVVITLMVAITLFVIVKPNFGMASATAAQALPDQPLSNQSSLNKSSLNKSSLGQSPPNQKQLSPARLVSGVVAGGVIGFHDGFFGPGTGIFLVFALLSLWSLDFLRGTGSTKVINLLTNLTALITFAASGDIDYSKGIYGAFGVGLGSFLGATFATKKGAKLIKPIFITVTVALVTKLLINYAHR